MTRYTKPFRLLAASAAAFTLCAATACNDGSPTEGASGGALSAAFSTTPVGFGDLSSSFVGNTAAGFDGASIWVGGGREAGFGRGAMMGGGLGDAFLGGIAFGGFGHRGPFGGGLGCAGTFNATTGRVVCTTETRNGLTITRSAAYLTTGGAVQQAFDSITTNSVNVQSSVAGTVVFSRDSAGSGGGRPGPGFGPGPGWGHGRGHLGRLLGDTATILSATTTVASSSERTTAGLAQGSTQRTVNGASRGTEATTGTSSRGAFTATRSVGDTTTGLVVPVRSASDTERTYPTAGTVIRSITATLSYGGATPTTISRREVITYSGTATASVTITENGTTRTCTRGLPRGALVCQ